MAKFEPLNSYQIPDSTGYSLLPFRFKRLSDQKCVATNYVGEHLVVSLETLEKLVHRTLEPGSDEFYQFQTKHFLQVRGDRTPPRLLGLKYRTKQFPISQFTGLHMFVVSLRCEHSCPYCQVSRRSEDRSQFDMSVETASRALDFTFRSANPYIKIEFQGGEPLLNWSTIKWIVEEGERRNISAQKNLQFVIATNLSQLNEEMLNFCAEHDVSISTSLDGPETLHNRNRPRPGNDSYARTIDGIRKARAALGAEKVSALMTTTKASLSFPREIVDEYLSQGFNTIFLRPLSPYGFAIKTKSYNSYSMTEWLAFYFEALNYIIDLNLQGVFFVEQYAALLLTKILTPRGTTYVDLQSPSGIGISAISFNYDGGIYASDESRMLAEMDDLTFLIGNLAFDNYEAVMLSEKLLEPLEQSISDCVPMCSECAYQPYCGSDPVFHHATVRDYVGNKATSDFCKKNMSILDHLVKLLDEDPERRRVVQSWIQW